MKPEQVKILIQMQDGSVSVMSFVTDDFKVVKREASKENIDAEIERAFRTRDVKPVYWSFIDEKDIPADRSFRNAWCHKAGKIDVDLDKAREIHRDRLRRARVPLLEELDKQYMKADEKGDAQNKKAISQRKQQLRDVTDFSGIIMATTPEELKVAVPEILADHVQYE